MNIKKQNKITTNALEPYGTDFSMGVGLVKFKT